MYSIQDDVSHISSLKATVAGVRGNTGFGVKECGEQIFEKRHIVILKSVSTRICTVPVVLYDGVCIPSIGVSMKVKQVSANGIELKKPKCRRTLS